ncbi:MAG: hypothetical protein J6W77_04560, partial [Prevotella sp.]|nr:hypothetical protein [Prevotella sp.]
MVSLKSTAKESAAETNAVTFAINVKENFKFMPNKIQFLITRIGTDSGVADVNWQNENGTITLARGMELNRNTSDKGWYTEYN